jgi:hypothetical protein
MTLVRPGVVEAELATRRTRVATRLVFSDATTFEESGTLELRRGSVSFRSLESGRLEPSPDGRTRHGTSVLGVVGGTGRFAGASGRITSNFVVLPDGEVTDEQVVVLFIDREET